MARTRFARRPAALLLFDLDRFKSINDKFGHGAGDGVLTAFCQLATSLLRPTDLFGRIGGEEFASLLPDTTRQDALLLAERLRAAFEATTHPLADGPLSATASVGVAISDDASSDLAGLLDVADQALYRAKAMGRNRVELSTAFGRTAVGAVARRSFRNGKWRLIWSSTVQGGGKRRGPRSEYLAQLGPALFLIAAGENASPFAQYHQLVWRVHNRVRARRVEAIVAVEDGLNPPPSPP